MSRCLTETCCNRRSGQELSYRYAAFFRASIPAFSSQLHTAQFVQNVWIESYDPTIEDSYRKQIEVDVGLVARLHGEDADVRQGRQCILEMYGTQPAAQMTSGDDADRYAD